MKIRFAIISLTIFTAACHSPRTNQDVKLVNVKIDSPINKEYLDWSKVKLNGTIPMISSFKDVVSILGPPDKIDTLAEGVNGSYFNKKFQYCYLKGVTFEKYDDTLVFSEIDFSKPTSFYLTDGKIRFASSSKDIDFQKLFPYSFENNELTGTSMDLYDYIFLATAKPKTKDRWDFTFLSNTGKLWRIGYNDPSSNNDK